MMLPYVDQVGACVKEPLRKSSLQAHIPEVHV